MLTGIGFFQIKALKKRCREEGIRTLEALARQHAFQACALNRSATSLYTNSFVLA